MVETATRPAWSPTEIGAAYATQSIPVSEMVLAQSRHIASPVIDIFHPELSALDKARMCCRYETWAAGGTVAETHRICDILAAGAIGKAAAMEPSEGGLSRWAEIARDSIFLASEFTDSAELDAAARSIISSVSKLVGAYLVAGKGLRA